MVSPKPWARQKYSNQGSFDNQIFGNWNVNEDLHAILSDRANKGLIANTWKQYQTVFNHISKCEASLGISMQFPWEVDKLLNFVGYLIKVRGCSSNTINSYISAIRMLHLTKGLDCPHLRKPTIDFILKGQSHHENLKEVVKRKTSRLPVTIAILRYLKRKLKKLSWPLYEKIQALGHSLSLMEWRNKST